MQWLVTNWFWILVGVAFVAMHLFGHGGHGGHGAHGGGDRARRGDDSPQDDSLDRGASRGPGGHQH